MSIDSSLKSGGALTQHRNVLTRAERVAKLMGRGKFDPETGNPIGMPKVGNRKVKAAGKKKKKDEEEGAEGAA